MSAVIEYLRARREENIRQLIDPCKTVQRQRYQFAYQSLIADVAHPPEAKYTVSLVEHQRFCFIFVRCFARLRRQSGLRE